MKIFRFDRETGTEIDRFNSSGFTLTRVAHLLDEAMIQIAYLEPNGLIGNHQAAAPRLFLVVQGDGWVGGRTPERTKIQTGQGIYWEEEEWHETGTETGLIAIIIETSRFDLLGWVPKE